MSDDKKPRRGRPRTLDADKVLDLAMRAYWSADPQDVSINALSAQAEVSKPSLYRVFGSEDGLMRAALDRYVAHVLADIFALLSPDTPLATLLERLIHFAAQEPRMETGCLYYKMRAARHRLGPLTRARVEEIDAQARQAFAAYLTARAQAGDGPARMTAQTAARYLSEQMGLAHMQRAAGQDPDMIRTQLEIAFSVFRAG